MLFHGLRSQCPPINIPLPLEGERLGEEVTLSLSKIPLLFERGREREFQSLNLVHR
jgi:hypothetical protein